MENQPVTVKISMPKADGFDRVRLVDDDDGDSAAVYIDHDTVCVRVELRPPSGNFSYSRRDAGNTWQST